MVNNVVFNEDIEYLLIEKYKEHFKEATGKELVAFPNDMRSISLDVLYQISKEYFKIDTIAKCRYAKNVTARTILFKEAKRLGYKITEIGKAYGYDHTSVIHLTTSKRTTWDDFKQEHKRFQAYVKSQKQIVDKKLDITKQ
jgi:hypothetical protein